MSPEAVQRVRAAMGTLRPVVQEYNVLDPKLCGNVRNNHFELWFARRLG